MTASPTEPPLAGWRVGVTADRRADQQVDALRRRGADVVHGCTMRTLDLSDDARLLEVSRALIDQPPDTLAAGSRSIDRQLDADQVDSTEGEIEFGDRWDAGDVARKETRPAAAPCCRKRNVLALEHAGGVDRIAGRTAA